MTGILSEIFVSEHGGGMHVAVTLEQATSMAGMVDPAVQLLEAVM